MSRWGAEQNVSEGRHWPVCCTLSNNDLQYHHRRQQFMVVVVVYLILLLQYYYSPLTSHWTPGDNISLSSQLIL